MRGMVGLRGMDAMPGGSRLHDPGTCATASGMRETSASRGRARRTGAGTGPICTRGVSCWIAATLWTESGRRESGWDGTPAITHGTVGMDAWIQTGCLTGPTDTLQWREGQVEGPDTVTDEKAAGTGTESAREVTGDIVLREEGDGGCHRASRCQAPSVETRETAEMHAMRVTSPCKTMDTTMQVLVPLAPALAVRASGVRTPEGMDGRTGLGTAEQSLDERVRETVDAHHGRRQEATLPPDSPHPHPRVRSSEVHVTWTRMTMLGAHPMVRVGAVAEGGRSGVLAGVLCERVNEKE